MTANAEGLVRLVETMEVPDDVFDADLLCDLNVPNWRWQMRGVDALLDLLREDAPDGSKVPWYRTEDTTSGFVVEIEQEWVADGQDLYSRYVFLARVEDGRISRLTLYCTGNWDAETRARQQAEAPMLEPARV